MDNPEATAGIHVNVGGNVEGNIVIGDGNTVITQAALPTQRRKSISKPPARPDGFVGRRNELQKIDDWITQKKTVIVTGLDGIGKTSLIKEAANRDCAKSQPDGVVVLEAL